MTESPFNREEHWDTIYRTRTVDQVSWYQTYPSISMQLISLYGKGGHEAQIIDIGGGSSNLVDVLLDHGYKHIDVLDVSSVALGKTRERLEAKGGNVGWIHSDVLSFNPGSRYDVWHDRAAFHFLTDKGEIEQYVKLAAAAVKAGGLLILATFSERGPDTCSDLPVHQYSEDALEKLLHGNFVKLQCFRSDHYTPRDEVQNFTYCAFERTATQN